MKYIIDIPNEMVIKSRLKGLTLGIAMIETSTQKSFIIPTNISLIPYIEPEKWVSCDERLPKYGQPVLTYNLKDDDYILNHIINEANGEWFIHGVDAWTPLPEAYREEE